MCRGWGRAVAGRRGAARSPPAAWTSLRLAHTPTGPTATTNDFDQSPSDWRFTHSAAGTPPRVSRSISTASSRLGLRAPRQSMSR